MTNPKRILPLLSYAILVASLTLVASTTRAQVRLPEPPPIELVEPNALEMPDEPRRAYSWPIAMMGAGTVMAASGAFAIVQDSFSCWGESCPPSDPLLAVPFFFGLGLFTAGMSWLIARAVRFRRAHRAFEDGTPRLAW